MIPINYIIKELLAEKTRFFLIILAIAWGTASITSMLAVGEGLRITFGRVMEGSGKALLFVTGGQTSSNYQGQALNQTISLTPQDLQAIKNGIPAIHITPEYTIFTQSKYGDQQSYTMLNGVEPIYGKLRYIIPQRGGRFINAIDIQKRQRVIVLGNDLAHELLGAATNKNNSLLGLFIYIGGQRFQIIGLMQKKLQFISYGMPDSYAAWIPASTFIGLVQAQNRIDRFIISPDHPEQLGPVKQAIIKIIAFNHHLNPADKNIVSFIDTYELQQKSAQIFTGMEIFLGIVGGLTLLVAGVGIANVMFISVRHATRDIGIRMAVGARNYQILIQYLTESLLTTTIGGIIGLIVAKIIITSVALIPVKQDILKFFGSPKPMLSPLIVSLVVVILGLTGLLAGFFPAKKAADIHPAEALRHE